MKLKQWLRHELIEVGSVTLLFFVGFAFILLLMQLVLGSHGIEFPAISKAVIAAMILAKVVMLMGKLKFMALPERPAWMGMAWRTGLYLAGTAAVLLLEALWHLAGEAGSWGAAWSEFLATRDARVVAARLMLVAGLLLAHETLREVARALGPGGLRRLLLEPPKELRPVGETDGSPAGSGPPQASPGRPAR